ncbi:MAG: sel1 repeat family protein [Gammaproteobacteria bacterium]|nr:sel1 repeat family protein [Gammaproteobacteria bacterium]
MRVRNLSRRSLILLLLVSLLGCARPPDARSAYRAGRFAEAYAKLNAAAIQGDVTAQNAVGVLYYTGVGVARDYRQAVYWFERAALAGDGSAQRHLGSMFRQGLGTNKDDFRAFGWYAAARSSGHPRAVFYMRWMALVLGTNQQALGQRIVTRDLKNGQVSHAVIAKGNG